MEEQKKYRTPKIEEFHIGFEFELFQGEPGKWIKKKMSIEATYYHVHKNYHVHIQEFIRMGKCRVEIKE